MKKNNEENKTIFRVGMEVYDSINYPDEKGNVIDIMTNDVLENKPIMVRFNSGIEQYTLDGRINISGQIPTLSTTPYALVNFTQKPLPVSEDEAVRWLAKHKFNDNKDELNKYMGKIDEMMQAYRQLLIIRDFYNEGEVFDKSDFHNSYVYSIRIEDGGSNDLEITHGYHAEYPFTFRYLKTAEKFLSEQDDLLYKIKPLL